MNTLIEKLKESKSKSVFTDTSLRHAIRGSAASRYGLVKRAIKSGDILHLRRGLYALGKKHQSHLVNLFEIAQIIYGPSYISCESALSYHGWIPEAVHTTTSVCMKRSKDFQTPFGLFSYTHIPSNKFYTGAQRVSSSESVFLIATPWRALIDYLYIHKKDWKNLKSIEQDLRIDLEQLENVDFRLLEELESTFRSARVKTFIRRMKKELLL